MQLLYLLFLPLLLLPYLSTTAQTKIIAHKSHSGSAATFSIYGTGSFGLGSWDDRLDSLIKVSDTVVVKIYVYSSRRDTLVNCPLMSNPNVSLDSIKQHFHSQVHFVGFGDPNEGLPTPILSTPAKPACTKPKTLSTPPAQKIERRKQRINTGSR